MSTLYPVSIPPKTLAQPLSSSGSSFVLSDILDWSGTALVAADLGDILYAVFRNTTNTAIEIMKIDCSTIADSAITITKRGLRTVGVTDDTEVAANKLDWNANETIVELGSNPPQLYNYFMRESDDEEITGLKTFDKDKFAMKGTSTGITVISTANDGATDYTQTMQKADGTIALTSDVPVVADASEINTGTDNAKFISPDALAGSNTGTRVIEIKVIDDSTSLTTGDGKIVFCIPLELNGMNFVNAQAFVSTASSSGAPTIQIRNVTGSVDLLTTKITIDANEYTSYTAATPSVIDTDYDGMVTGDIIAIDVDVAGTGTKGLGVILSFRLP
jgi:hypothetical protein